mgnify:CR=1 FL=1
MRNISMAYDTAVYSLWFGLNYGSILTSCALYKTLEQYGKHPALIQKQPELWSAHYAEKDNIAGRFVYQNCKVLEVFDSEEDARILREDVQTYIIGSDIVWNYDAVGKQSGLYYFLEDVPEKKQKIAYASCFGGAFTAKGEIRNNCGRLLHQFQGIAVKEYKEAELLQNLFRITPEMVLDPVFLCDKQFYIGCANRSAAKQVETAESFIFSYIECCDDRKRQFLLRGNDILMGNHYSPLRNFIDINRFPESKALLKLEPAYHIRVEDWLHYLIHSEFVITDNYYGMCFALIFEKPFVVLANIDLPNLYQYQAILQPLGLEERIVILQEDLKKKEYLFRKPIRYNRVNKVLNSMKYDSEMWLKKQLGISLSSDDIPSQEVKQDQEQRTPKKTVLK